MIAAGSTDAAIAFIEIGVVILGLAMLSRLAGRIGITAIPLYLLAGLAVGKGGLIDLDVTEDFIALAAEIGVLLLLFSLGLEYSDAELRSGLRTGLAAGVVDMALNAVPGRDRRAAPRLDAARRGAAGRRHVDHLVGCRVEGAVATSAASATARRRRS